MHWEKIDYQIHSWSEKEVLLWIEYATLFKKEIWSTSVSLIEENVMK